MRLACGTTKVEKEVAWFRVIDFFRTENGPKRLKMLPNGKIFLKKSPNTYDMVQIKSPKRRQSATSGRFVEREVNI